MSSAGTRFDELVRIMRSLRGPDGCPWDREQTLPSLRPFLLEETYEVLEAIDTGDTAGLCEELGDLLFEAVFLAQIAEEAGHFSVADALGAIGGKLVRRHPHVFGDAARARTAEEALGRWEAVKQTEATPNGTDRTTLGGVPRTLPALLRAHEYGTRAAAVGFDWTRAADVLDKIDEEVRELRAAVAARTDVPHGDEAIEDEMGDLLFAIANLSRTLGVEPESALRRANDKFRDRFTAVERRLAAAGRRPQECTLDELEAEWQAVKRAATGDHHREGPKTQGGEGG